MPRCGCSLSLERLHVAEYGCKLSPDRLHVPSQLGSVQRKQQHGAQHRLHLAERWLHVARDRPHLAAERRNVWKAARSRRAR